MVSSWFEDLWDLFTQWKWEKINQKMQEPHKMYSKYDESARHAFCCDRWISTCHNLSYPNLCRMMVLSVLHHLQTWMFGYISPRFVHLVELICPIGISVACHTLPPCISLSSLVLMTSLIPFLGHHPPGTPRWRGLVSWLSNIDKETVKLAW